MSWERKKHTHVNALTMVLNARAFQIDDFDTSNEMSKAENALNFMNFNFFGGIHSVSFFILICLRFCHCQHGMRFMDVRVIHVVYLFQEKLHILFCWYHGYAMLTHWYDRSFWFFAHNFRNNLPLAHWRFHLIAHWTTMGNHYLLFQHRFRT